MIKVYHAKNPTFGMTNLSFPADYELVAYVETDDKEKAFELTNHIHQEWWKNEGVKCLKEARSTSVGDVLEVNGKLLRCENCGWMELEV